MINKDLIIVGGGMTLGI